MYSFHQKNLFYTQTFDGEKIKKGKGRTSCLCISWNITPKHFYFSSQSALGTLYQTSWGEASSGTHLTLQLKASNGWWAEVSRTAQHILHPSACLPAASQGPTCPVTPLHSQPCLHRPSPVEPHTKDKREKGRPPQLYHDTRKGKRVVPALVSCGQEQGRQHLVQNGKQHSCCW